MVHAVIGAQWGDEGKGKIVDLLSQKADCVVRFHGGNNAGHTVVNSYGTFPLHLIPSGIFSPKTIGCITGGVVIDLAVLADEIRMIKKVFPDLQKRLFISPRCHVIMPYHKLLDRLYEEAKGKARTGTTGRGIGPVYADKVSYNGIRLFDLANPQVFREKLSVTLVIKNKITAALGGDKLNFDQVYQEELIKFKKIQPFIKEPFVLLHEALADKKHILLEGAHGMFLDNDWGTYPFVSASNVVPGAAAASAGIPASHIKKVTGIVKAYTTRVGGGPFPTELLDRDGEQLRRDGHEFGTTTGRPRRCGWLDIELLKFAKEINGMTDIALTKLDVLDNFKTIKICVAYRLGNKSVRYVDCDAIMLASVRPVYKTFHGWQKPIRKIRKFSALPQNTKNYIREIEKLVGIKVSIISIGPDRHQTIFRP